MQSIGLFGAIFNQGTNPLFSGAGGPQMPCGTQGGSPFASIMDAVQLSQQAQGLMQRGHCGQHRPRCHHVRPHHQQQAPQANNADRIQGLDREIGTLNQQLAQYMKSGDTTSISQTQNLIQQDQVKQLLCAMGVRM